jgi:hypothetical protein
MSSVVMQEDLKEFQFDNPNYKPQEGDRTFLLFTANYVATMGINSQNQIFKLQTTKLSNFDAEKLISIITSSHKAYYLTPKFYLIPTELYKPELILDYYQISFTPLQSSEQLITQNLDTKTKIVYSLPNSLAPYQNKILPFASLLHKKLEDESNYLSVFFALDYVYIAAYRDESLVLCNAYHAEKNNDKLYFILLALEQLALSTQTPVYLSGFVANEEEVIHLLSRYLKGIRLTKYKLKPNDSLAIKDFPMQYFQPFMALINS